jgi:predicted transcriptional regulator
VTVLACCLILILLLYWASRSIRHRRIYFRRPRLLSSAELQFFHTLETVVGENFRVLAKVRVADLIEVRGLYGRDWWAAFSRVSQKHVDFLVASCKTLEVLLAIELDDRSHEMGDRQKRDELLNAAFLQAGIPLIRFNLDYSTTHVRDALCEALRMLKESHSVERSWRL